ncbi:MAG TPA: hypothetical protein VGZ02_12260 [Candidatus Baltobacteraceae bacterium]|jgi:hypothetical protein|nr:hypothetical protein [Candidatus Baltobacteraceae bacterium]
MTAESPGLTARLSFAWVAFTIECDNEAEARMQRTGRPWLTSMAMWWNCMRYVDGRGIALAELAPLARTKTNMHGMQRWGYVTLRDGVVRATSKGLIAKEAWAEMPAFVERRWRDRFGNATIDAFVSALRRANDAIGLDLPDTLPILGPGLFTRAVPQKREAPQDDPLPAAMAKLLTAIALAYERDQPVSLAIAANVLRVTGDDGTELREMPARAGISKAAVAMAASFLQRSGYARNERTAASRFRALHLTASGKREKRSGITRLLATEEKLAQRIGTSTLADLALVLDRIAADGSVERSPLFAGLRPPQGTWRASLATPKQLPYFPMVLHRGGFPDGS